MKTLKTLKDQLATEKTSLAFTSTTLFQTRRRMKNKIKSLELDILLFNANK